MTVSDTYAKDVVREALRRETLENMEQGLVLFDGQWMTREDMENARRRAIAHAAQHSIEVSVLIVIVALVGVGFLALINLIV